MNEKSRLLDQIRFDVGRVPDRAYTLKDFYLGIIKAISKNLHKGFCTGIYIAKGNKFQLIGRIGELGCRNKEKFGDGELSICAIRGQASVIENGERNSLLCPFYNGHHLKGIVVISVPGCTYKVNDDDIIFLKELSRFIELKQKQYHKK